MRKVLDVITKQPKSSSHLSFHGLYYSNTVSPGIASYRLLRKIRDALEYEEVFDIVSKIIELVGGLLGLLPIPAHKLSDMGPVFLLRVVIFFVGTRAGRQLGVVDRRQEGHMLINSPLSIVFDLGDRSKRSYP